MPMKFANNATTTLATGINTSATSIVVVTSTGALFPALGATDYFYATMSDSPGNLEIVKVTARVSDTFTVVRAQDGTTAKVYAAGDKIELRVVRAAMDNLFKLDSDTAAAVINTPAGNIVATNVQAALNELDSKKALLAGSATQAFSASTFTGALNGSANTVTGAAQPAITSLGTLTSLAVGAGGTTIASTGDITTRRGAAPTTGVVFFGNTGANYLFYDGANYSMTGGGLTVSGNVTAFSDERLKDNWADLPADFVEQLAHVKHGTYTRTDSGDRQVGVSAQSLQRLLPEAVQDGEYLSVAYGNAALAACVMLAKRVVDLESRLAVLEGNK